MKKIGAVILIAIPLFLFANPIRTLLSSKKWKVVSIGHKGISVVASRDTLATHTFHFKNDGRVEVGHLNKVFSFSYTFDDNTIRVKNDLMQKIIHKYEIVDISDSVLYLKRYNYELDSTIATLDYKLIPY